MDVYEHLARRVRAFRRARSLSQEALAARAGLHQGDISLIESNRRKISFLTLCKIAKGFDMTAADLVTGIKLEE